MVDFLAKLQGGCSLVFVVRDLACCHGTLRLSLRGSNRRLFNVQFERVENNLVLQRGQFLQTALIGVLRGIPDRHITGEGKRLEVEVVQSHVIVNRLHETREIVCHSYGWLSI
jgi:hypothetical protein